jgi:dihydrofolate reductase
MRRLVLFDRVSADGYFAGADGSLDWVIPEDELDRSAAAASQGPGTILFGRRTYQQFESFWPHALSERATARDPHRPGRASPELRAMAVWINEATKVVFSKTLERVTWKNSRLVRGLDPRDIAALKQEPGTDMLLFGSGTIASQLSAHALIDEYQLIVSPLLLGDGRPLISGMPAHLRLRLLELKPYPSGNVMLRYAPSR